MSEIELDFLFDTVLDSDSKKDHVTKSTSVLQPGSILRNVDFRNSFQEKPHVLVSNGIVKKVSERGVELEGLEEKYGMCLAATSKTKNSGFLWVYSRYSSIDFGQTMVNPTIICSVMSAGSDKAVINIQDIYDDRSLVQISGCHDKIGLFFAISEDCNTDSLKVGKFNAPKGNFSGQVTHQISFLTPFQDIPSVFATVQVDPQGDLSSKNELFTVYIRDITKDGFKVDVNKVDDGDWHQKICIHYRAEIGKDHYVQVSNIDSNTSEPDIPSIHDHIFAPTIDHDDILAELNDDEEPLQVTKSSSPSIDNTDTLCNSFQSDLVLVDDSSPKIGMESSGLSGEYFSEEVSGMDDYPPPPEYSLQSSIHSYSKASLNSRTISYPHPGNSNSNLNTSANVRKLIPPPIPNHLYPKQEMQSGRNIYYSQPPQYDVTSNTRQQPQSQFTYSYHQPYQQDVNYQHNSYSNPPINNIRQHGSIYPSMNQSPQINIHPGLMKVLSEPYSQSRLIRLLAHFKEFRQLYDDQLIIQILQRLQNIQEKLGVLAFLTNDSQIYFSNPFGIANVLLSFQNPEEKLRVIKCMYVGLAPGPMFSSRSCTQILDMFPNQSDRIEVVRLCAMCITDRSTQKNIILSKFHNSRDQKFILQCLNR